VYRALKLFQRRPGRFEVVIQKLSKSWIARYRRFDSLAISRYLGQYHGEPWTGCAYKFSYNRSFKTSGAAVHSFRVNRLNVYRHFLPFFTVLRLNVCTHFTVYNRATHSMCAHILQFNRARTHSMCAHILQGFLKSWD